MIAPTEHKPPTLQPIHAPLGMRFHQTLGLNRRHIWRHKSPEYRDAKGKAGDRGGASSADPQRYQIRPAELYVRSSLPRSRDVLGTRTSLPEAIELCRH